MRLMRHAVCMGRIKIDCIILIEAPDGKRPIDTSKTEK
jgi:hypothetical protein